MTLTQFIKKYQGTKVDFDKAFGAQCVDLYRQYCFDVLNVAHTGAVEGAKDLKNIHGSLVWVDDSVTTDYSRGDVLVWGATPTNKYGHVAILVEPYNTKWFIVFEQDGFEQDGAKLVFRSREGLLGYLYKG